MESIAIINFNTGVERKCFDALISLMETSSIEDVSIIDILTKADISRSTFYRHYLDKYDLLNKSYEKILENTVLFGGDYGNFKTTFVDLYTVLKEYPSFFAHAFKDTGQNSLFGFIHEKMVDVYMDMLEQHGFDRHNSLNVYLVQGYIHGTLQITYDWLMNGAKEDVDTILELVYKLMPDTIRTIILLHYM